MDPIIVAMTLMYTIGLATGLVLGIHRGIAYAGQRKGGVSRETPPSLAD